MNMAGSVGLSGRGGSQIPAHAPSTKTGKFTPGVRENAARKVASVDLRELGARGHGAPVPEDAPSSALRHQLAERKGNREEQRGGGGEHPLHVRVATVGLSDRVRDAATRDGHADHGPGDVDRALGSPPQTGRQRARRWKQVERGRIIRTSPF